MSTLDRGRFRREGGWTLGGWGHTHISPPSPYITSFALLIYHLPLLAHISLPSHSHILIPIYHLYIITFLALPILYLPCLAYILPPSPCPYITSLSLTSLSLPIYHLAYILSPPLPCLHNLPNPAYLTSFS